MVSYLAAAAYDEAVDSLTFGVVCARKRRG